MTDTVTVEKYHGTSNDFVVVSADARVPNRVDFAVAYCDRETGIDGERTGADGVLFLDIADEADGGPRRVEMTLVQPDGSIADMCGNGARVVAAWAAERTGESEFVVVTPAGDRKAVVHDDEVTVEMGCPSFDPQDVPLAREEPLVEETVEGLIVTAVNTGVPHAVAFVDDVDAYDIEAVAPPVRHADVFPEGANVNLAAPDGDGFRQRTFERGVEGETLACGTGAVAIAAVAERLGRWDGVGPVRVTPPGGDLSITVPDDGPATLTGPVEYEFTAELEAVP